MSLLGFVRWGRGVRLPTMHDRAEELRERAAECLALARKAILPEVRAGLLILAQKLHEMAELEPASIDRLDHALQVFNENQLSKQ
jgi:hypothetical protein